MGLLLLFLILPSIRARGDEIFSDDFETGDIASWSLSLGGDCELIKSAVTDCDFDLGLGSWMAAPSSAIDYVLGNDSDGHPSSGAVELTAGTDGAEMSLCFAKSVSGSVFYTRQIDARKVSGELTQSYCFVAFGVYDGADCSGEQLEFSITAFAPESAWQLHAAGQGTVPARAESFLLQIGCTGVGGDAVLHFDDLVVTAEPIGQPRPPTPDPIPEPGSRPNAASDFGGER